jgi:hypothetical protein
MVRTMLEKVKRVAEGRQRPSPMDRAIRSMGVVSDQARPRPLGS